MLYYDGRQNYVQGEGSVKNWKAERAVYYWKAEFCIEGEGDVNDGKAEWCIEGEGDVNDGKAQVKILLMQEGIARRARLLMVGRKNDVQGTDWKAECCIG